MSCARVLWDYTALADAYVHRPPYGDSVIEAIINRAGLTPPGPVADIGAGTGNLTTLFLRRGYNVAAVEPNAAMRRHGLAQTERFGDRVNWSDGVAEDTRLPRGAYALVTFGSSFNVVDAQAALKETAAILRPRGWFMCCWNHRDVQDPLQNAVEAVIRRYLPHFAKGKRAEDQEQVISESGLFEPSQALSGKVVHRVRTSDWLTAWGSHATLVRQAGDMLEPIMADIGAILGDAAFIDVPYITQGWLARSRND